MCIYIYIYINSHVWLYAQHAVHRYALNKCVLIHRGCMNVCMRAHGDGACCDMPCMLYTQHAVHGYALNKCVLIHRGCVNVCIRAHGDGACCDMPCMLYTQAPLALLLTWMYKCGHADCLYVYIYIYIYILIRTWMAAFSLHTSWMYEYVHAYTP